MKKGLFLILSLTLSYLSMAQVPNSFSYQMVIRNGNNELVANTTVGIRIGLLGGNAADTVWYEEEHKVKTNLNGLAYIIIGKGNILKGAISTIDWTRGPFFIKSETDPTGGKNYSLIIVSQMLSVPYAIYAGTAKKLSTPVSESDPLFNKSIAKGITSADTALWNTETDPIFIKSISKGITESDITYWNNKLSSFGETDPTFNASISKGITAVDTAYWNKKLSSFSETDPLFNQSVAKGITALDTLKWNSLLNLSDTILRSDMILGKLNISDTSAMLSNYRIGINAKVNVSDTAGMLTPYLRKLDTASVSNRINLKVNIADTAGMLTPYLRKLDTASVSDRINLKVNIADTAGMLTPYLRKLDTASVSNRINLKVNIADTASMLEPYLREPVGPVNGDILYYNINKWERLPKGQDGQFLTLSSGIPNWTSIAPGSPTGVSAIAGNGQVTVSFTAPTNTGGTPITGYTVTSSPSGGTATGTNLSLTVTGLTNGTSYTFTVVATNSVGNSAASLSSTPVTPCINTAGPASSTLSLCINTTLSNITHSTTGATGIGSAIGLPTGVSAAWASNTITISGTPTVSGTFNYSIPLTGGCGSVNATGTITVTDANIAGAASSTPTLCINTLLIDITHSTLGATGIGSATGLPTGVSAAWASNTITISGTPNASGTFNYSIPLTGGCGSVNATGTITVACIPTVTTTAISSITTTGASSGGNVTDEGGVSVIARGVVYSTSPNPTISNSTTSNGTGAGSFTSTLTSLTSATTYYVRAYATNSLGTAYGNELTFSTSAPIPTATLNCPSALGGIITFMKHNLGANQAADPLTPSWELNGDYWLWGRQTKAADGPTESNTNAGAISGWNSGSLTLGAMGSSAAWLDGSKTANDPCPSGFRVPTKEQWRCVIENNTKTYQGTWSTGFGSPTNYSTGLTLTSGSVSIFLPAAGSRASNYDVSVGTGGDLQYRGRYGNYLSSSLDGSTYYFMQFYDGGNASGTWTTGRTYGYSVRCVAE